MKSRYLWAMALALTLGMGGPARAHADRSHASDHPSVPRYTVIPLTGPAGEPTIGSDLNARNDVVGAYLNGSGTWSGALWTDVSADHRTPAIELRLPEDANQGFPTALNHVRQSVGNGSNGVMGFAMSWSADGQGRIAVRVGRSSSFSDVNDAGQAVGWGRNFTDSVPIFWDGSGVWRLPTSGPQGSAWGINNAGQVVGYGTRSETDRMARPMIWTGMTPIELPTLDGGAGEARAINEVGVAVGWCATGDGLTHPTLWQAMQVRDLGLMDGAVSAVATHVNLQGIAIGYTDFGPAPEDPARQTIHATLWAHGQTIDLNDVVDEDGLEDGWQLTTGSGLNDAGWILVQADHPATARTQSWLLKPVADDAHHDRHRFGHRRHSNSGPPGKNGDLEHRER